MRDSIDRFLTVPDVDRLDDLVPGRFELHAPVDMKTRRIIVLGVEINRDIPLGTLDIDVDDHSGEKVVTISRPGGEELLQVQNRQEGVPVSDTPFVFAWPVPRVVVHRADGEPWKLRLDDVEVVDVAGLSHFLRIVAQFGIRAANA
jgi:hypothetical protein